MIPFRRPSSLLSSTRKAILSGQSGMLRDKAVVATNKARFHTIAKVAPQGLYGQSHRQTQDCIAAAAHIQRAQHRLESNFVSRTTYDDTTTSNVITAHDDTTTMRTPTIEYQGNDGDYFHHMYHRHSSQEISPKPFYSITMTPSYSSSPPGGTATATYISSTSQFLFEEDYDEWNLHYHPAPATSCDLGQTC